MDPEDLGRLGLVSVAAIEHEDAIGSDEILDSAEWLCEDHDITIWVAPV